MKDKKLRLEQSLYKWLDTVDEVEEDISSLVDGHNIAKSRIAAHISDMKIKLRNIENLLKYY